MLPWASQFIPHVVSTHSADADGFGAAYQLTRTTVIFSADQHRSQWIKSCGLFTKETYIMKKVMGLTSSTKVMGLTTKKTAYIALVLDESGSMSDVTDLTIDNYNEQIAQLKTNAKKTNVETYITLVVFSDIARIVFANAPVADLVPISEEDYAPGGLTALRDGMSLAINTIREKVGSSTDYQALVVTLTDGQENCSAKSAAELKSTVRELQGTNLWSFVYMGASEADVINTRDVYSFSKGNTKTFVPNAAGFATAYGQTTTATMNFIGNVAAGASADCYDNLLDDAPAEEDTADSSK